MLKEFVHNSLSRDKPVADPGFLREGCANLLFGKIFAENCMKEFGPKGQCPLWIRYCKLSETLLGCDLHQTLHQIRISIVRECTNTSQTTGCHLYWIRVWTSHCRLVCCFPHTETHNSKWDYCSRIYQIMIEWKSVDLDLLFSHTGWTIMKTTLSNSGEQLPL